MEDAVEMKHTVWILMSMFVAWMNGMVSSAEPLKPDVGKAAVLGVRVVSQPDHVWLLQGTEVNRRGSAGTMTNSWGYATFPSATRDFEIKGRFNILRPGKPYSFRYGSYFPMQYHYVVDQPGYDFAIVLRRQNSGTFYRIQFSTKWNEVALWKEGEPGTDPAAPPMPTGFFAAVKKNAGITTGADYAFTVKIGGSRLQLESNGKPLLTYEDKVQPLASGGWGFGVTDGAQVRLSALESDKAGEPIVMPGKKRPDFKVEDWHGETVVFDGDEPVVRVVPANSVWCQDVKFKPGYRAQVSWPFVLTHGDRNSKLQGVRPVGDAVELRVTDQATADAEGATVMVLRYDPAKDSYVYDFDKTLVIRKDDAWGVKKIGEHQGVLYYDLFTYNSMRTNEDTLKVSHDDLYTASSPYRMALVKGVDGTPYRWPIHHFYGPFLKASGDEFTFGDLAKDGYFILYPEKVVCPAMEIVSLGEDYEPLLNHCVCYWDMHWGFTPLSSGHAGQRFKAGDAYRMKFRMLGYSRAAADKLAAQAKLLPVLDPRIERPYYVSGANDFSKGGNVEETAGRLVWMGNGKWDKTVGRNDMFSMRMTDSATISTYIGYNSASAAARKAEMTAWVRTEQGWKGPGVRLGIEGRGVFGNQDRQWSDYTATKPGDWQKVTYAIPFPTASLVCIWIETSGTGTLRVDDVEFKKTEP
jgi:hypothetical protein